MKLVGVNKGKQSKHKVKETANTTTKFIYIYNATTAEIAKVETENERIEKKTNERQVQ